MEAVLEDTVTRVKNVDPSHLEVTRPLAKKVSSLSLPLPPSLPLSLSLSLEYALGS